MNNEEKRAVISKMKMGELRLRRKMINFAIRVCIAEGDPESQVGNYRSQLARIDGEIRKRVRENRKNGGKPAGVSVQAKPGRMGARGNL